MSNTQIIMLLSVCYCIDYLSNNRSFTSSPPSCTLLKYEFCTQAGFFYDAFMGEHTIAEDELKKIESKAAENCKH